MAFESYISLAAFPTALLGKGVFKYRLMKSNSLDVQVNNQSVSRIEKSSVRLQTLLADTRLRTTPTVVSVWFNNAMKGVRLPLAICGVFSKTISSSFIKTFESYGLLVGTVLPRAIKNWSKFSSNELKIIVGHATLHVTRGWLTSNRF